MIITFINPKLNMKKKYLLCKMEAAVYATEVGTPRSISFLVSTTWCVIL